MSLERFAVPLQVVSAPRSALLRPGERSYDSTLQRLDKRTATTTTVLLLLLLLPLLPLLLVQQLGELGQQLDQLVQQLGLRLGQLEQ